MNPPQKRQWLARNGEVHGPYELAYLLDLNNKGQLVAGDSFCPEGEDKWMSYGDWRATYAPPPPQKRTVISATSRGASKKKTGRVKIPQPTLLASLPKAKKAVAPTAETDSGEAAPRQDPQQRLFRLVEAINDHRRAHPHRHPLYFAEPQQLGEVAQWLDAHHKNWDTPMLIPGTISAQEVMHRWFLPAVAIVKPDLVKPSHRTDFGEGRPWRSLEEIPPIT